MSEELKFSGVVLGGKYQSVNEGSLTETEMDSGGDWREVSRG